MDVIPIDHLLEKVQRQIHGSRFSAALKTLYAGLQELHKHSSEEDWKRIIVRYREHAASNFFLQDPFIRRAFEKPRGYAGDAVMMDFIYALDGIVPPPFLGNESELEKQMYLEFNSLSTACRAVRERRRIITRKIDETAARILKPRILSVACGHLRELLDSSAAKNNALGQFVAVDQDEDSLSVAKKVIKPFGETIPASVMDIIRGKKVFSGFDLIYVSGLYDYLSQKAAVRLTEKLFVMLNQGGRLLLANFLPTISCRGMMEACGDWWLNYRNEAEMQMLFANLPEEEIHRQELFEEVNRNIIFIEVEKRIG